MELVKVKCKNCGGEMVVYDTRMKEQYCTIHCLESAMVDQSGIIPVRMAC
ncbi:hypothetical protein [Methanococcoides alaskense]|uniref:Ribosomal protein S27E n=1 Tax=Methanococcoides alaskense TaxID=325778 RepID=A0AA90TY40_9EURY|nr:hypothetical protein [Methanococcoides alaskense]MDA0525185.1 hypothetical protein [Methanococcoides alaskense]MDR6221893.1 ribosomal protein S27E [Methanococcoides alaskense]